jgi:hypothetical protein
VKGGAGSEAGEAKREPDSESDCEDGEFASQAAVDRLKQRQHAVYGGEPTVTRLIHTLLMVQGDMMEMLNEAGVTARTSERARVRDCPESLILPFLGGDDGHIGGSVLCDAIGKGESAAGARAPSVSSQLSLGGSLRTGAGSEASVPLDLLSAIMPLLVCVQFVNIFSLL